jgi:hypothetical protein
MKFQTGALQKPALRRLFRKPRGLPSQPRLDHCLDVFQLGRPQRLALSDAVTFCRKATAAGRRGVLCDEPGVP